MECFVWRTFVVALLMTAVCFGNAEAFYVEGLMSGMSSTTVEKILRKHGFEIMASRVDGSLAASNKQENGRVVIASFCDDRLVQVENVYEGKFSRFVELVESKKKELGAHAAARVLSAAPGGNAAEAGVVFAWVEGETTVEIVYAERAATPQVSLFHRMKNPCR